MHRNNSAGLIRTLTAILALSVAVIFPSDLDKVLGLT